MRLRWIILVAALAALTAGGSFAALKIERRRERIELARNLTGGDPARAPKLMIAYGCASCHEIPGLAGPSGRVGPPLRTISERVYIGGVATNTPENLVGWIANPKALNPKTAMPITGISEAEARDVAAFLYAQQ